jgi:hypothetical protein
MFKKYTSTSDRRLSGARHSQSLVPADCANKGKEDEGREVEEKARYGNAPSYLKHGETGLSPETLFGAKLKVNKSSTTMLARSMLLFLHQVLFEFKSQATYRESVLSLLLG